MQTVSPELSSDSEAIKTAFAKRISGRMPENRGNGLKFVLKNIQEKSWDLYYHSGKAICEINNRGVYFRDSSICYYGGMALIFF